MLMPAIVDVNALMPGQSSAQSTKSSFAGLVKA
jgi:hypothetical protein